MPNFMRQSSGGRSTGNRGSKGGRAPGSMGGKTPKIIQMPQFEKVELKRAENAWVKHNDQDKDLTGVAKEMKVVRYKFIIIEIRFFCTVSGISNILK